MGITPQQFEHLKSRVSVRPRRSKSAFEQPHSSPRDPHRLILGIDPSLRGTGYGVIRLNRPAPVLVAHGTIRCPAGWERSRCLVQIAQTLRHLLEQHHPTVCVVEGLFYAQNLQTALIWARAARAWSRWGSGPEIYEIAPRKVKQAIVGYGAAQKIAVAKMVQRLLGLAEPPAPDAADALALALTFSQENGRYSLTPPKKI
jgi:crossover junction endodeoxyribonuclease RuvC